MDWARRHFFGEVGWGRPEVQDAEVFDEARKNAKGF